MEDSRRREKECSDRHLDSQVCGLISKDKIKETLKKMTNGKAEGPDQIPVEVLKCLGETGLEWLRTFSMLFLGLLTCPKNGGLVQSSLYTRTRVIFKIVIILGV